MSFPKEWWNMSWTEQRNYIDPSTGTFNLPHTRCMTEHGMGTIVCCEADTINKDFFRYGVELDSNPFSYPIAFFMSEKVEIIN